MPEFINIYFLLTLFFKKKFEEIINSYYELEKELKNKNLELKKSIEEISLLREEITGLKKELEDCDQLRHCLSNLKNTFITS